MSVHIGYICQYILAISVSTYWSYLSVHIGHICQFILDIFVSIYWTYLSVYIGTAVIIASIMARHVCIYLRAMVMEDEDTYWPVTEIPLNASQPNEDPPFAAEVMAGVLSQIDVGSISIRCF